MYPIYNLLNVFPYIQRPPWASYDPNHVYWYEYVLYYGFWVLIALLIINFIKWKNPNYHSHWNTLVDNFHFSTFDFYELLEKELNKHRLPDLQISKVRLKEGHMLSSRRLYLRLTWGSLQYDICAAPFASGFFVSWWLINHVPLPMILIYRIPYVGKRMVDLFFPMTYYKTDTTSMLMTYVHSCVQKVIKDITEEKGIQGLSELQQQPILNNIFQR